MMLKPPRLRRHPLATVYRLIEPGPVVLVTTAGSPVPNIMTMSWLMMLGADPPLIGCGIGRWNHSWAALQKQRACVIAIPDAALLRTVVRIGNCSGRDTDKFSAFHLTPLPAALVAAPLIAECWANLECRVVSTALVKRYNVFVVRVVRAWTHDTTRRPRTFHANGDGTFVIDGVTRNLKRDMVTWTSLIR